MNLDVEQNIDPFTPLKHTLLNQNLDTGFLDNIQFLVIL